MLRRSLSVLTALAIFSSVVTGEAQTSNSGAAASSAASEPSATIPNAAPASPAGAAPSDIDAQAALKSVASVAAMQSIGPTSLRKLAGVQLKLWSSEWNEEGLNETLRTAGYSVSGTVEGVPVSGLLFYMAKSYEGSEEGQVMTGLAFGGGQICVAPDAVEQLLQGMGYNQTTIPVLVSNRPDQSIEGYDHSKKTFPNIRTSYYRKTGHACLGALDIEHVERDDAADAEGRAFAFLNDKMDVGQALGVLKNRGYVCGKQTRGTFVGEAYIDCKAGPPNPPVADVASRMVELSVEVKSGVLKMADMRDLPPERASRTR